MFTDPILSTLPKTREFYKRERYQPPSKSFMKLYIVKNLQRNVLYLIILTLTNFT